MSDPYNLKPGEYLYHGAGYYLMTKHRGLIQVDNIKELREEIEKDGETYDGESEL